MLNCNYLIINYYYYYLAVGKDDKMTNIYII